MLNLWDFRNNFRGLLSYDMQSPRTSKYVDLNHANQRIVEYLTDHKDDNDFEAKEMFELLQKTDVPTVIKHFNDVIVARNRMYSKKVANDYRQDYINLMYTHYDVNSESFIDPENLAEILQSPRNQYMISHAFGIKEQFPLPYASSDLMNYFKKVLRPQLREAE